MIIVVDTREKDEYTFGDIATIKQKLDAGDYSIAGLVDRIAIERKSIDFDHQQKVHIAINS